MSDPDFASVVWYIYANDTHWKAEKIQMEDRVQGHTEFLKEHYTNIKQMFGDSNRRVFRDVKNILATFESQNLMNETLAKFSKDLKKVMEYLNL